MQPTITPNDRRRLKRACNNAIKLDPGLQIIIDDCGYPEPRKRTPDFATLLQVIISQQLSTRAAAAIGDKVSRECRHTVTWRKVLNRSDQTLRDCGLSARKVEYAKGLAEMFQSKQLVMTELQSMDTEAVVERLMQIRGFGRWSGEIFAMFALGHKDIYPADDLALQVAIQRYLNLNEKPTGKQTMGIATRWSPYRSAVSLMMWKFYGATTLENGDAKTSG